MTEARINREAETILELQALVDASENRALEVREAASSTSRGDELARINDVIPRLRQLTQGLKSGASVDSLPVEQTIEEACGLLRHST